MPYFDILKIYGSKATIFQQIVPQFPSPVGSEKFETYLG